MMYSITFLIYFGFVWSQEYEGCFKTSTSNPNLPSLILNRVNSFDGCIKECRSRYYMFAGLMNTQRCYCGSKFVKNLLLDSCTVPCTTDASKLCEDHEAMKIYSTGQKGPSKPREIQISPVKPDGFLVTWQPPDVPNGNITFYTLSAIAIETYANNNLPAIESKVQGSESNNTILRGLQPGSKYNISITANNEESSGESNYVIEWTPIGPPDKPMTPKILSQSDDTITIMLSEGSSEYGPVSAYQVVVVEYNAIPPSDTNLSYPDYKNAQQQGLGYYVTADFDSSDFHHYRRFIVGDRRTIGGYYNAPLKMQPFVPRIGLVVVSRDQGEVQYSYSDLTNSVQEYSAGEIASQMKTTVILLCVAIVLLGSLLVAAIIMYCLLRHRHEKVRMTKLPEQQELTLQGPLYEVDNMGYIPEDVPERVNHYQELKNKVWTIPQANLSIDNTPIRRGRFGTVHLGMVEKDEKNYSIVAHKIADRLMKPSEKQHMLRELDLCIKASTMRHLAGLVGTCETSDTLFVVLEMPPNTLKNQLLAARSGTIFPIDQMLPIASAIASALRYLENFKIVHTHLCARSIGITNDWVPKVMGHGIAKYALEDLKYVRWKAVECLYANKKHQPAVVWAFGVLLWEMLSMGGTPYSNLSLDSDVEEAIERGVRLSQLPDVPDPLYEVMLSCWQTDPQERPTFDELTRLNTLSICPITAITEPYIPELELN